MTEERMQSLSDEEHEYCAAREKDGDNHRRTGATLCGNAGDLSQTGNVAMRRPKAPRRETKGKDMALHE